MINPPDNDILWEYMDRLRWRLRRMPEDWVADVTQEIRQHLEEMVADLVAAGYSKEAAVRSAESKFGSPEKVGDRLMWGRSGRAIIVVFGCWMLYGYFYSWSNNSFGWEGVISTILTGCALGVAGALQEEFQPKKPRTKEQRLKDNVISTAIGIGTLAAWFFIWQNTARAEYERTLINAIAMATAAVLSWLLTRTLRERRRNSALTP